MSEIFEAGKAQFRQRLDGALRSVIIPEWVVNNEPVEIFFKPAITFKQQSEVFRFIEQGKPSEAVAMTFILRSLDADGKPLFRRADHGEVMRSMDPEIIGRVVDLMAGDELDMDIATKN